MTELPSRFPTADSAARAVAPEPTASLVQDLAGYANTMFNMSPSVRLSIAKQLKKLGLYRGKPTGLYSSVFLEALQNLEIEKKNYTAQDANISLMTHTDFIGKLLSEGGATLGDGDGQGAIRNQKQTYIYSATQSAKVLDAVSKELLGRELTTKEKKKYSSLLNAAQRANPSRTSGIGTGATTTQGVLDEQQFLTEKLAGTAEAKTAKANDAYSVLMEELGGLR